MAARQTLSGKAADALKDLDELRSDHDSWVQEIEKAEDAYNGVYKRLSEAKQWAHHQTPRYAAHIVETTIAAMLDPDLKFRVESRPKFYEPGEYETAVQGAKAMEMLLGWQFELDRFAGKQRDIVLQERYGGISWQKVYWKSSTRLRKRLVKDQFWPVLVETEEPEVVYDAPCVDVCNNRDIVWDMGAQSVERCGLIAHRIYVTYPEALSYERAGAWRDVERLKDMRRGPEADDREKRKDNRIEVWEIWRREASGKIVVYTVGERNVLLAEKENPYWHGEFPFSYFSSRKKPLMLAGWSQMDMLRDVQEQLWSIEGLTLDALMLSIMPIIMYREDVDDPDALVFEPYARWPVTDPNQVKMWTPEYSQAQVGLPHIQRMQASLQNLAGSQPFTSTGEARTLGANTATEASLVSSIAQRSMSDAKAHLYRAYERIGQLFVELNQQFVRDPVYVTVLNLDERAEITEILPEMLQGEFSFSIKPMSESLIRQERRSEAMTFFQALVQAVPVFAMAQQPLNVKAVLQHLMDAFDMGPVEKFLSAAPQQVAPQGSPPALAPPGPGGVTNGQLAAGPQAPSNPMSQSPEVMMQQFLASQGAGQSVG